MKVIYTLLFFSDALLLIILSSLFMKFIDKGASEITIISILAGIAFSILLLVYFLHIYLKIPPDRRNG